MKLLTRAFADWCQEHSIPLSDVTLVVRANNDAVRDRIEHTVAQDLRLEIFDFVQPVDESRGTHRLTLNGVRVSFSTLDRSRTQ